MRHDAEESRACQVTALVLVLALSAAACAMSPPDSREIKTEREANAIRAEVDDLYDEFRASVLRATGGRMVDEMTEVIGVHCGDAGGWPSRYNFLKRAGTIFVARRQAHALRPVRLAWAAEGRKLHTTDPGAVYFEMKISHEVDAHVTVWRTPEDDRHGRLAYEFSVITGCLGLPESLTSRVTWT